MSKANKICYFKMIVVIVLNNVQPGRVTFGKPEVSGHSQLHSEILMPSSPQVKKIKSCSSLKENVSHRE